MCPDRLAVYTTVYPGVQRYLPEWYASIEAQGDREFDLWIGLDALGPADVVAAIGSEPAARWIEAGPGATPAAIRAAGIAHLAPRYPAIVFVDSDDLLHPSRVSAARAMAEAYDVGACALDVIDGAGRGLGVVFAAPEGADPAALLPRRNVFGLSNTVYRSATLQACLPIPPGCALVDWLLATRAWAGGAAIGFDRTPRMRYRQYADNIARVLQPFSARQVLQGTERVLDHYRCTLDSGWTLPDTAERELGEARARVRAFHRTIHGSPAALADYVDRLNRLPPEQVWWWYVAHPDLEDLWTN